VRRYEIVHLFSRRLSTKVGRVQAILSKLQEAGLISSAGPDRKQPVDMAEPEIVKLLLAIFGESGIGTGPQAASLFGALTTAEGQRLDQFIEELLFGQPKHVRHIMVRQNPAGVSVTADGVHLLFGEPPSRGNASPARIVPGEAISAIAAELQGHSPEEADAIAALHTIGKI